MSDRQSTQLWLWAGAGLILVFLLLNLDLLSMRCIFKWDAWDAHWPWFNYTAESLNSGRWPLWVSNANCGFPFYAEPNSSLYYPVFLFAGLSFGGGYKVFQLLWLGHWLWAILGFFLLLKRLEMSPSAAFVGCVIFGFNGFFIGNAEHTTCIAAMSYFPWVVLMLEYSSKNPLLYSCTAGMLLGLSALGGNPVMTIYMVLMICLWSFLRLRPIFGVLRILFITLLVAGIVLAPSYVSFLVEGNGYTDRVGLLPVIEALDHNRFSFDAIISLIAPAVTAKYATFFNNPELTMINGYFGIFGVVAVIAVALDRDLRSRWMWLLVFMLIAFLLSLGSSGVLGIPAHYLIPVLRLGRHTAFFKSFWLFGGAVLAAAYFDRLADCAREEAPKLVQGAIRILIVILLLIVGLLAVAPFVPEGWMRHTVNPILTLPNPFSAAAGCLIFPMLITGSLIFIISLFKTHLPRKFLVGLLLVVVVGDAAAHKFSNQETVCWGPTAFRRIQSMETAKSSNSASSLDSSGSRDTSPNFTGNLWAFDGNSYVRAYLDMTNRAYDMLVGNNWPQYEETRFLDVLKNAPRFWLTPNPILVDETDANALSILRSTGSNDPVPVFVHESQTLVTSSKGPNMNESVKPGSCGSVQVLVYEQEKIKLNVNAPADCVLFATERYSGSWKAYVDGKPEKVCKANFCFRAIKVPAGDHSVVMEFTPWVHWPLALVSWGTSSILMALWLVAGILRIGRH